MIVNGIIFAVNILLHIVRILKRKSNGSFDPVTLLALSCGYKCFFSSCGILFAIAPSDEVILFCL
jgi:hypothetical protein